MLLIITGFSTLVYTYLHTLYPSPLLLFTISNLGLKLLALLEKAFTKSKNLYFRRVAYIPLF
jgi:hypothetical protein